MQISDAYPQNYQPIDEKQDYIVNQTASKIIKARKTDTDLKKLFFEILDNLNASHALVDHEMRNQGTLNQQASFYNRRDYCEPVYNANSYLTGTNIESGKKLLDYFSKHLYNMECVGGFKKSFVLNKSFNGRDSSLEIEVLTEQDFKDRGFYNIPRAYLPNYISHDKLASDDKWTNEEIIEYRNKFIQFKKESPAQYHARKISWGFLILGQQSPSPGSLKINPNYVKILFSPSDSEIILGNMKNLFVHAVLKTKINDEMCEIADYFTWMYESTEWKDDKTPKEHPILRMKKYSKMLIVHQDELLISKTLNEISNIFENVVYWNKSTQSQEDLKDQMGILCYLLSHNMRNLTRTVIEDEQLERAIYLSHGFTHSRNKEIDLLAFTNPLLTKFMHVYKEITVLEPLENKCD